MKLYSFLFLLCAVLCGCTTVTNRVTNGRDFDERKTSQIKKGVTTADRVVALYGEADQKQIVSPQRSCGITATSPKNMTARAAGSAG